MNAQETESVEAFRARAARWIERDLPRWNDEHVETRDLQRLLFDHGFAGIAFPRAYGGAGLTLDHQKAFYDEATAQDRQVPTGNRVSIGMLGPTILDHGSEDAQLRSCHHCCAGTRSGCSCSPSHKADRTWRGDDAADTRRRHLRPARVEDVEQRRP